MQARSHELAALDDLTLVEQAYVIGDRLQAVDDVRELSDSFALANELWFVLDEVLERFAPRVALQHERLRVTQQDFQPEEAQREFGSRVEGVVERLKLREERSASALATV